METITDDEHENFVTVVSVGTENKSEKCDLDKNSLGYVTVLTIGDNDDCNNILNDIIEEVLVYRLPGERLGFGLKFEGGTKANECVKRLIIQSCAPDTPASRAHSSWGNLCEGDEVIEIDNISINTMTRIDCVRSLKDSNVVIKLLVKHFYEMLVSSVEDLPQVVSAEKKRPPPPPPPVPPRKIPKKFRKAHNEELVTACQIEESTANKPKQSDVYRGDRRFSDSSLGPPIAQVYIDSFLQESTQSLSESDDGTGSSISTIVDRFGSIPTTRTSSLAGSSPSTPTFIQKHLDFSNLINHNDDDKLSTTFNQNVVRHNLLKNVAKINQDGTPLQPPTCFQDAPLSYGNEDMKITDSRSEDIDEKFNNNDNTWKNSQPEEKTIKKPPVPPRSRDLISLYQKLNIHDENMNISNLPRLINFVPKLTTKENIENSMEIVKIFLENERKYFDDPQLQDNTNPEAYDSEMDLYSSKWSLSSQLATIGEVEEDNNTELNSNGSPTNSTPIVIIENVDSSSIDQVDAPINVTRIHSDINGKMETLWSDCRQPPDGHEFPDFVEDNTDSEKNNYTNLFGTQLKVKDNISEPSSSLQSIPPGQISSFINEFSRGPMLNKIRSMSNSDLTSIRSKDPYDSGDDFMGIRKQPSFHGSSQSLIDMSMISNQKNDRLSFIAEQRRKGFSKLKGLVIPEHVGESDTTPAVNIPVIVSHITPPLVLEAKNVQEMHSDIIKPVLPTTLPPIWSSSCTIPKYSPAFKRKTLQVFNIKSEKSEDKADSLPVKSANVAIEPLKLINNLTEPPKCIEITSPTKSESSYDTTKANLKNEPPKTFTSKLYKDLGASEDESDDSAVSSSQSSYTSRCSPPSSPNTRSNEIQDYDASTYARNDIQDVRYTTHQNRLSATASVDAINRKNILASAKCRSGKDFKVGSPIVQRKYDEEDAPKTLPPKSTPPSKLPSKIPSITENRETIIKPSPKALAPNKPVKTLSSVPLKPLVLIASRNGYSKSNPQPKSVQDLRQSFEKASSSSPPPVPQNIIVTESKLKKPKINIEAKAKPVIEVVTKKVEKVIVRKPKEVKPITTEVQESSRNCRKIVLSPEFLGGSIGITLAGGTDYETKEITVHRIRPGSVAYQDGKLKKGDHVISINGKEVAGLTHIESVEMLKEAVPEFVLMVEDGKQENPPQQRKSYRSSEPISNSTPVVRQKKATTVIQLIKDGAGLGFSIEGGRDSPQGDLPLRIKKIFQGGSAEKTALLNVGDEILAINEITFDNLSRIEAWSLMKKLADGTVTLHIHR